MGHNKFQATLRISSTNLFQDSVSFFLLSDICCLEDKHKHLCGMFVFPNYSPLIYSRTKAEMLFTTPRILQVRLLKLYLSKKLSCLQVGVTKGINQYKSECWPLYKAIICYKEKPVIVK